MPVDLAAAARRPAAAVSSLEALAFWEGVPVRLSRAVTECSMMEASSLEGFVVAWALAVGVPSLPAALL